ncbi:hypothetical protein COLO4_37105 [Corchorus olitorius]|uniref:Uncharacterized protein n=1 Tax=Corchorus olitorius TaxID=93759 RepID=A0A1R3G3F8_9ROSI|nr:hypothetical protein COLO4_37105 [Corchorus olitorius]
MADIDTYTKQQKLLKEQQNQANPTDETMKQRKKTIITTKTNLSLIMSLKSRVLDGNNLETSGVNSGSLSRSNSSLSSRRFSKKGINGEFGGLDQDILEKKKMDESNVVLPSPIPWRSRSGRLEVKDDDIESTFNRIETRSFGSQTQTTRLSRSSSLSSSPKSSPSPPLSSPKKLSPTRSLSMETQAKTAEDLRPSFLTDDDEDLPRNFASEPSENRGDPFMGKQREYLDNYPKGKSVRTRKEDEIGNGVNGKTVRFDQKSFRNEKLNREGVSFMPKPTFMEFPQEEKQEFVEKLVMETADEEESSSESEDEEMGETSFVSSMQRSPNNEETSPSSGIDGGSDVDKKADEFIAKVREQIRLQRIDSIKRSSGQMKRSSTR